MFVINKCIKTFLLQTIFSDNKMSPLAVILLSPAKTKNSSIEKCVYNHCLQDRMQIWICFLHTHTHTHTHTHSFSLCKTLIDGLDWCGLLVDYSDVFIGLSF